MDRDSDSIIIIIIIIHEYYYGGAVALLLQDHLTVSVSRRESIYRETLPKQHSFQFLTEGDQSRIGDFVIPGYRREYGIYGYRAYNGQRVRSNIWIYLLYNDFLLDLHVYT